MKNHIILLLFLLDIFGCAPGYHWVKPDATQQAFVKDSYKCERNVEERAYFGILYRTLLLSRFEMST